jgi:UDP-glucose 4-epimerase
LSSIQQTAHLPFRPAGSHTVLQLLDNGYSVVIMDNLRNSFPKAFDHMKQIAGDKADKMKFVKVSTQNLQGYTAVAAVARTAPARWALYKVIF